MAGVEAGVEAEVRPGVEAGLGPGMEAGVEAGVGPGVEVDGRGPVVGDVTVTFARDRASTWLAMWRLWR